MRILKFGGTSLAGAGRIAEVAKIVGGATAPAAVVVSALAGVTSALSDLASVAVHREHGHAEAVIADLRSRHEEIAREVAAGRELAQVVASLDAICAHLTDTVHGITLLGECSPRTYDAVVGAGERLSATVVAAALRRRGTDAEMCDAREIIVSDATYGGARVDMEASAPRIAARLARPRTQVVTGFIAATPKGDTTTLGRGGSDLTAVLLGVAVGAERVEIWTDVDGVLSADPRLVPQAFPLDCLSYDELLELSHFGAKVIHPPSVHPARKAGVPLVIRNTLNPAFPGTRVCTEAPPGRYPIRGIASVHQVTLMRLQGDGMVGVPGIAKRLFGALARRGISIILISQASSEHSICIGLDPVYEETACRAVDQEFELERGAGLVDPVIVESGLSAIAVVGEAMRERIGIAGRIFGILGDERINVRAIAQGSSELNVSLVIDGDDEVRALRAIHNSFFAPRQATIDLFVVGHGRVGSCLTRRVAARRQRPVAGEPSVRLAGVITTRAMVLAANSGSIADAGAALRDLAEPPDLEQFVEAAIHRRGARAVVADCTAGDGLSRFYSRLLAAGVFVVTANKRPLAGSLSDLRLWRQAALAGGSRLAYETTVGAALPMLSSIRSLVRAGDTVHRLRGVLSGTLGFLCERLMGGVAFSHALREAFDNGYTEPDPRQDLDGLDVARKLLILCRESGWDLEADAIEVTPFGPAAALAGGPLEELWQRAPALDGELADAAQEAAARGRRLVYLAEADPGRGAFRVGLEAIGPDHPCFHVEGTDNLLAVSSAVYDGKPLVIQGPGAGPGVTAAGVLADILEG